MQSYGSYLKLKETPSFAPARPLARLRAQQAQHAGRGVEKPVSGVVLNVGGYSLVELLVGLEELRFCGGWIFRIHCRGSLAVKLYLVKRQTTNGKPATYVRA